MHFFKNICLYEKIIFGDNYMLYGDKIRELREENGLTQEQVASILNIKRGLYSQYEIEYTIIPLKHLISISNYFNVSLDYIFSFTNQVIYDNYFSNTNNVLAGEKLKNFRKENKLTQDVLASDLNTNRSVIANYERGRTLIATPFLYTICKKYNISADYLLGRTNEPKYLNI